MASWFALMMMENLTSGICSYDGANLDSLRSTCSWLDGQDLRYFPLTERKHKLRSILPKDSDCIYCDHVEGEGESLFRVACENDLEGVVAKRKYDPYLPDKASWLKIRNKDYSQWEGREELFERERESDPACNIGTNAL